MFHVTAITHRDDALFQTSTIGGKTLGRTDTAQLSALRTEVAIWHALQAAVREPVAVYATTSSGGAFNVRVAIRQRVPGEARNAIGACMGALANCKNVFVVDPDVDIFSDEQMDWAMATRFQPDRDLIVMSGMRTLPLDPSLPPGSRIGAKAGYDLTWPFGQGERLEARVPAPPKFAGKRFRLGRGGAGRRPEVLRGADDRGGQPRRPRGGAHAWAACATSWRSTVTAKGATSSSQANSRRATSRRGRERRP